MSELPETPRSVSPDDSLPPVEPPNAGFIIRLFVVPAVIVGIIVGLWVLINWWTQQGNDPSSMVRALGQNNAARWQAALNLANALNDPRNTQLRQNEVVGQELINLLQGELRSPGDDEESLKLRIFLCQALGFFQMPEVLPTLLDVEASQRDPQQKWVRVTALKGIKEYLESHPDLKEPPPQQVVDVMLQASRDEQSLVRSMAAFGLMSLGTDQALQRLKEMLADPHPDVRDNVAIILAQHGHEEAVDVLVEMLGPKASPGTEIEDPADRKQKHLLLLQEALAATEKLAEVNATANLQHLHAAVEKLVEADVSPSVTATAKKLLPQLEDRPPSSQK